MRKDYESIHYTCPHCGCKKCYAKRVRTVFDEILPFTVCATPVIPWPKYEICCSQCSWKDNIIMLDYEFNVRKDK